MVEMKKNRESFWAAGVAALTMHSLVIFACSLGIGRFEGYTQQKNNLRVEMVFMGSEPNNRLSNPPPLKTQHGEPMERKEVAQALFPKTQKAQQPKKAHKGKHGPTPTLLPSGISCSSPIYAPAPGYPVEARRKKIQGIVLVRLFLTENGKVHNAIPLSPHANPILEDAALTAVHGWRFKPGAQTVEVPIEFKLRA